MSRDTVPEIIENADDSVVNDDEIPQVDFIHDEKIYCWCCGYPSDDLTTMKLEDGRRNKIDCIVCGVCLESPWILDSWLNPWLYLPDTRKILEAMAFQTNRIIDSKGGK